MDHRDEDEYEAVLNFVQKYYMENLIVDYAEN